MTISNFGGNSSSSHSSVQPHQSQSYQTLEQISSILISEMKKKPRKEKALRDALDLQERIRSIEEEMELDEADTRKKKVGLDEHLNELERQRQETLRSIEDLERKMEQVSYAQLISIKWQTPLPFQSRSEKLRHMDVLRSSAEYRDRRDIERLSRDIEQLNFHASKVKTVMSIAAGISEGDLANSCAGGGSGGPSGSGGLGGSDDIGLVCPVCLVIPDDQIFNCVQCDNMICGACRSHVSQCPTCRKNFKNAQPRRNRLAERLIASRR